MFKSFCCLFSFLNSVSHDALCLSAALVTARHVTRAVDELWGVATTSVPLAVTQVTHTHTRLRALTAAPECLFMMSLLLLSFHSVNVEFRLALQVAILFISE